MAELQSSLPLVDLGSGDRVIVEAIDPATGAQVSGVVFSHVAITYDPDAQPAEVPLPPALIGYHPGPN